MFVTRITFRGLTQVSGTFGINFALFLTILMFYTDESAQMAQEGVNEEITVMSDATLRKLMIWTHFLLMASTLCISLNWLEGIL
mmetsp:Transcript_9862/g.12233  ORF Transcript_9862/g.12233 Transcript_9862/m.12233 type:complete len:84 (+) Transcript_9862:71-322(+)